MSTVLSHSVLADIVDVSSASILRKFLEPESDPSGPQSAQAKHAEGPSPRGIFLSSADRRVAQIKHRTEGKRGESGRAEAQERPET
jgi:hypothetical protein